MVLKLRWSNIIGALCPYNLIHENNLFLYLQFIKKI
nr:MAG TPA: hypothetical protein [Caudoviricetes sp.]